MTPLLGCDRSSWKSTALALTEALHAQGVRFAIDRVSIGTKPDAAWATNRQRQRDAGWQEGGFHFLYGEKLVDPRAQARVFVDRLGATGGPEDCITEVDMEWVADPANAPRRDDGLAFADEFAHLVPGHPLGVYSARGYLAGLWPDAADTFDYLHDALWRAGATATNLPKATYFGGYSGFGPSPLGQWGPLHVGKTIIDGDVWFGSADELRALGVSGPDYAYPFDCSLPKPHTAETYPGHSPFSVDINRGTGTNDLGDPVLAMAVGEVVAIIPAVGWIKVRHAGGFRTWYVHCQHIGVKVGQKVKQGQKLAEVGAVHPTIPISPHLHVNQCDPQDKPVRVTFHHVPCPASLSPSRSVKVTLHCDPTKPPEVQHMKLKDVQEAGFKAVVPATTAGKPVIIEDAGGVKVPGVTLPGTFTVYGRTPGGRIAIAIPVPNVVGVFEEAYVKATGVTVTPATDAAAARKEGRAAMKATILAEVTGTPV